LDFFGIAIKAEGMPGKSGSYPREREEMNGYMRELCSLPFLSSRFVDDKNGRTSRKINVG
jgi:hypothetical protein